MVFGLAAPARYWKMREAVFVFPGISRPIWPHHLMTIGPILSSPPPTPTTTALHGLLSQLARLPTAHFEFRHKHCERKPKWNKQTNTVAGFPITVLFFPVNFTLGLYLIDVSDYSETHTMAPSIVQQNARIIWKPWPQVFLFSVQHSDIGFETIRFQLSLSVLCRKRKKKKPTETKTRVAGRQITMMRREPR